MAFPYKRGAENIIANGEYEAVICKVSTYNNPDGADKLIVEFSLEDGRLFSHFFTPGFESFDQLLLLAGVKLDKAEGEFDEQVLKDKMVKFTTKITTAKNGNEYCNVVAIEELEAKKEDPKKEDEEEKPFEEDEKKSED